MTFTSLAWICLFLSTAIAIEPTVEGAEKAYSTNTNSEANVSQTTSVSCLNAVGTFWSEAGRDMFFGLLHDKDAHLRQLAAEGLAFTCPHGDSQSTEALIQALAETERSVLRSVILALGQINGAGAADALVASYKFDDGKDPTLTAAYIRALERCGKTGIEKLIGLARSGDDGDRDAAVAAFLALRTRPGAEAIPELLSDPHLSPKQRAAVIKSYTNYLLDPPVSVEPLLDYFLNHPNDPWDVQAAAIKTLAATGGLKQAKVINTLTDWLDSDEADWREVAIATIEMGRLSEAAPRLVQALGDDKRSLSERIAIIKALRGLDDKSAVPVLVKTFDKPEPAALRLETFRTLAALDRGATEPVAWKLLEQADEKLGAEAITMLSSNVEGAKKVGRLFLEKKVPGTLLPQVQNAVEKYSSTDPDAARLLAEVMKREAIPKK